MQEINEELDKLSKQRAELKQEQANLIAQWARETK